jgi:uncharacterized protein
VRVMERLFAVCSEQAGPSRVTDLTIGLGYTAVTVDGDHTGLSFTWFETKTCCSPAGRLGEIDGRPATDLLGLLLSDDGIERSIGVATANAVNHTRASGFADDEPPGAVIRDLGAGRDSRVAMVGYFPPVVRALEERGAVLEIIDSSRGLGDRERFAERLRDWAEIVVVSGTALLNDTVDDLLAGMDPSARAIVLGPTTPLVPEAFASTLVVALAGMVVLDAPRALKLVRRGAGTPEIQRHARKVACPVP